MPIIQSHQDGALNGSATNRRNIMKALNEFKQQHPGKYFWSHDAGQNELGQDLLDVLVYDSAADLDEDDDNSLAIARATVIDDGGLFGRVTEDGHVAVFNEDGSVATRIDARVWPLGSDLSGAYEHPQGITISRAEADKINLPIGD
jgi:hypothetical protein